MEEGDFLYKREVNKSVMWDGFGINRDYLGLFYQQICGMKRGETKNITILFEERPYQAIIKNLNNNSESRTNDAFQIRYPANGKLAQAFQKTFYRSYNLIVEQQRIHQINGIKGRLRTNIPEELKEYIVLYSSKSPDTYVCEPLIRDDIDSLKAIARNQSERVFEAEFNFDVNDDTAGLNTKTVIAKIRKYNKKFGDSLKLHYEYRCQICGKRIGEKYESNIVEAHHIDYFVKSQNNDISNLLIVCPNHHGIIHDRNPIFDYKKCTYKYPNGLEEGLVLNDHLGRKKHAYDYSKA